VAIGRRGAAARQIQSLFEVGATGLLTDGQLLERFASARSGDAAEMAFAALVDRHGPLVFRVCRSVLRDDQAAHDAFQATFLVLVAKGKGLWVEDSLAPWLHAVAHRVALSARGSAARRRRHEQARAKINRSTTQEAGPETRELGEILHEEIEALPERYRVPIVLCDLEGRSHDEAARHLGWPVGTVKSRQARGRDRLRERLTRRGIDPTLRLGSALVPQSLARQTIRTAAQGIEAATAPVASLTKEVLMAMLTGQLKWVGILLLGVVLATTGALAIASGGGKGGLAPARPRETVLVLDDAPRDPVGKIYLGVDDGVVAIDPRTGAASRMLIQCKMRPRVSPDARWIAFEWDGAIWVRELEKLDEPKKVLDLEGAEFGTPPVWSPDGSKLIVSLGLRQDKKGPWRFKTVRINVDGSGREELKIPDDDGVQDWAPGDRLVTTSSRNAEIGWELYVMKPDGSEQVQITKGGTPFYTRFSPDGKRVLYADGTTDERRGIWVVDSDGKNRRKVLSVLDGYQWSACWSPDGKRIAVIIPEKKSNGAKSRLTIVEVDGDQKVEFPLEDIKMADMPDWR